MGSEPPITETPLTPGTRSNCRKVSRYLARSWPAVMPASEVRETLKERTLRGSKPGLTSQRAARLRIIGAGLMIRSLAALWDVNPGFDPRNVLSFNVSLTSDAGITAGQLRAKYRETLRQFERVPGVKGVSVIGGSLPMTGDSEVPFWIEGQPNPANENEMPFALFYLVSPAYQPVMRIPLERGRFFNARDDEHTPVVAVIDSSFAHKYFPGQDPVGRHLNVGLLDIQPEIVGVSGHVEHWGLGSRGHENLQAQIYLLVWQVPDRFWPLLANGAGYVVRSEERRVGK